MARHYPGRLALGCALDFFEASGYYGLFALLPLVVLPALQLPGGDTSLCRAVDRRGELRPPHWGVHFNIWLTTHTVASHSLTSVSDNANNFGAIRFDWRF